MPLVFALGLLGSAGMSVVASQWLSHYYAPESPLASLFITGARHSLFETGVFLGMCAVLFALYALVRCRNVASRVLNKLEGQWLSLALPTRTVLLFLFAAGFVFALNAPGIIHGYFHSDDFPMTAGAVSHSFAQIFWLPYSDHAMPFIQLQTKFLYELFGVNPIPYNILLWLLATLIPFLGYLLLRTLRYRLSTFFLLMSLFGSSVVLSNFLTGFYAVTIYPEVTLFFLLSLLAYVHSRKSRNKSYLMACSLGCLLIATFLDVSGIWTTGAYILFAYLHDVAQHNIWSLQTFVARHKVPVISALAILGAFLLYLYELYTVHSSAPFVVGGHTLSLDVFKQLYFVYTAGAIAQFFLPSAGIIVSQPRFLPFLPLWSWLMFALLAVFVWGSYQFFRHGNRTSKLYGGFFLILVAGTGLLTALGRPTTQPAAWFPVQQTVMPFFFLAMFLAIALHDYINTSQRKHRVTAVVFFCIIVLAAQHAFAFFKNQNLQEVLDSRHAVEKLQATLVPALQALAQNEEQIYVPDLRGLYINPYSFGRDASVYRAFLSLPTNLHFVDVRHGSFLASTSPHFIDALKDDERLRAFYLSPAELETAFATEPFEHTSPLSFRSDGAYIMAIPTKNLLPQKQHIFTLDVSVPEDVEKVFIDMAFDNAFHATGTLAIIRLDQYSTRVFDTSRRFVVRLDLNQVYAFALSQKISNVTLSFATPGSYVVHGYRFEEQ